MSLDNFKQLLERVKAGDQYAALQLAIFYAPVIRERARKLIDQMRLARFFDSGDICQSVLFHFFQAVKEGRFSLSDPVDLAKLFMAMVHNRVIDHARHLAAERDRREQSAGALELLPADVEEPSVRLSRREIADQVRGLLSEEEWRLVEARLSDRSWEETARLLGIEPDAARMRYRRIVRRLKDALGSHGGAPPEDEPGNNYSTRW
jgi:RNA polymerase sigma factor (sigma-70 family)